MDTIYEIAAALTTLHDANVAGPWHKKNNNNYRMHILGGKEYASITAYNSEDGLCYMVTIEGEPLDSQDTTPGDWKSFLEAREAADEALRARGVVLLDRDPETNRYVLKDLKNPVLVYDKSFGDELECACGHSYYRHFDPYEQMAPVGCKYCDCGTFQSRGE